MELSQAEVEMFVENIDRKYRRKAVTSEGLGEVQIDDCIDNRKC